MIGIIILNYRTYIQTIECVESIMQDTNFNEYKIYIVDNASPNDSYQILKKRFVDYTNIKVINVIENSGFAKGNNIGIEQAILDGVKTLVLTNNDIIFNTQSIKRLIKSVIYNEKVVIAGPKIYDPHGNNQHSSRLTKASFVEILGMNFLFKKNSEEKLDEANIDKPQKVFSVSGCCFAISIDRFKEMGAFDENTFLYNEENILGEQAEQKKFDIYFDPTSSIVHHHGATTGRQNLFVTIELIKSTLYYWRVYRSGKIIDLLLIYLTLTSKSLIKSLYNKQFRINWVRYQKKSFLNLIKEIKLK